MDGNKQFQASFIVQQYVEIFSRDSSSQDSSLDSVPVFLNYLLAQYIWAKKGTSSKSSSESEPTTATNDAILVFAFINCPSFYPFVWYVTSLRND